MQHDSIDKEGKETSTGTTSTSHIFYFLLVLGNGRLSAFDHNDVKQLTVLWCASNNNDTLWNNFGNGQRACRKPQFA